LRPARVALGQRRRGTGLARPTLVGSSQTILRPASPPGKLEVYERYLQVPHYIVYSRYSQTLRYFKLVAGRYEEQPLAPQPPLIWLPELHLGLGIWAGEFQRTPGQWLRWCDQDGHWVLTETEQERYAKERERRRAVRVSVPKGIAWRLS
jgi:hypothetical protein